MPIQPSICLWEDMNTFVRGWCSWSIYNGTRSCFVVTQIVSSSPKCAQNYEVMVFWNYLAHRSVTGVIMTPIWVIIWSQAIPIMSFGFFSVIIGRFVNLGQFPHDTPCCKISKLVMLIVKQLQTRTDDRVDDIVSQGHKKLPAKYITKRAYIVAGRGRDVRFCLNQYRSLAIALVVAQNFQTSVSQPKINFISRLRALS